MSVELEARALLARACELPQDELARFLKGLPGPVRRAIDEGWWASKPWTFIATPRKDRGERYGNVYFPSNDCRGMTNGPCTIAPGASVRITYTTTNGIAWGTMSIFDHKKKLRSFDCEGAASRCPYVKHSGNTGSVAVNDPANGDWNAWADQW